MESTQPVVAWQLTSPAGFEDFVAALGVRAPGPGLPPPAEVDVPRLVEVAAAHGIDILGPPLDPVPRNETL